MDETPRRRPKGTVKANTPPPLDGWRNLPPELTSYIIAFSLPGKDSSRKRMEALYSTRMVSRTWRDTIDSTPSLWSVVSSDLPLHVNSTAIQRSGRSPLQVYLAHPMMGTYRGRGSDCKELLELAATEIRRWSIAYLWLPFSDMCSLHLTSPAPLLRTLRITSRGRDGSAPIALFGGFAPKLEVLKVIRLPIDWTSSFIHGLRKLDLVSMREEQITTQQVLEVLVSAPLLEQLDLSRSTLDHHPQSPHTRPTIIQLPALKTIRFQVINTETTIAILCSIRVPNCTTLVILDELGDTISAPSFPEPTLSHFSDFQRLTLSANNTSTLYFDNDELGWKCLSISPNPVCLEFDLDIPYDALTIGVEWVTNVVGFGTQELVHEMEVGLNHDTLSNGDLAAYLSLSRCQSVTKLTLHSDHVPNGPILDLLGSWRESEDGTGRLPAFPGLGTLVLSSEGWTLDELEVSISRRFGEREDNINQKIPNLSIVIDTSWYCDYGGSPKPDLAQLQRVRTAKGVKSLARIVNENEAGMRAVVYEDDTEL